MIEFLTILDLRLNVVLLSEKPEMQWEREKIQVRSPYGLQGGSGQFNATVDFDPGAGVFNLTSSGYSDVFISKLDSSGDFVWAQSLSGSTDGIGRAITVDDFGNVYTTGNFQDTTDFNPGIGVYDLISAGAQDIFVVKLSNSNVGIDDTPEKNVAKLGVYPNPSNGMFTLQIGLESEADLQIEIVNVTGQKLKSISESKFNAGSNSIAIDATEFVNGVYFVKVYNESIMKTMKFVINKHG